MGYFNKLQITGIFIFLLCVIGCASDEANRYYLKYKLPPKKTSEVEVLRAEPQKPYTVIADFQALNVSFQFMRKRAAEVGADAVIIVPVGGNYSWNEVWAGNDQYANTYTRLIGTAIKYSQE
jgi:hypothetical protein